MHQAKGLARLLTDVDLPPERLRIHISEVGPGERSHPPHQHDGVEAFYMLEGEGTLEIDAERQLHREPARRSCSTPPSCTAWSTPARRPCAIS